MTTDTDPFEPLPIPARTFDAASVLAYAAITDDFNPIHCDPTFAASTEFGTTIVHGTLVVAPLWDYLGDRLVRGLSHEVRFLRPTPVGATVDYCRRVSAEGATEYAARLADGAIVATVVETRA